MSYDDMGDYNKTSYEKMAEDIRFAYDDDDMRLSQRMPGGMPGRMPEFGRGRDRGFNDFRERYMRDRERNRNQFDRDRDLFFRRFHRFPRDFDELLRFLFLLGLFRSF